MVELARLTSPEAAALLSSKAAIGIIPIGATEQHGPHLEVRTDTTIASELARRVDEQLGTASVLCPPVAYGASEHHLGFPGTLSLRPASVAAVLRDICGSLITHGLRRILIINGHGGNSDIARLVAREVRHDTGCRVGHAMWGSVLAKESAKRFLPQHQYHHACEVESSIAWECDEDLLRVEHLQHGTARSPGDGLTDAPTPRFDLPRPFEELSADGALGRPSMMDPAWGRELVDQFVEETVAFARLMLSLADPLDTAIADTNTARPTNRND